MTAATLKNSKNGHASKNGAVNKTESEASANYRALVDVVSAVAKADTVEQTVRIALDAVRSAFGWAYGSYWSLDESTSSLKFALESGTVNDEFRRATENGSFSEGVGLSGRAWKTRDLFFIDDIGQMHDCFRAPIAQRAGVKSGVCFPIIVNGNVIGTMDFFATEVLTLSDQRLDALRNVGQLVSSAITRIRETRRQQELAADANAVNRVLESIAKAETVDQVIKLALDTVRDAFGWAYGSFWRMDNVAKALRFSAESGTVNSEFHQATMSASFKEGVGLSGKTWQRRELIFVKNIGDMTDCVRAPIAVRAGVKSGICFPVIVDGEVAGTMDFFTTETLVPSEQRLNALRNVGRMVSEKVNQMSEAARRQGMLDNLPINLMTADLDGTINYANPAALKTLKSIERILPVAADKVVGGSYDVFHKDPSRQRKFLADAKNLPHNTEITLGNEILSLNVAAIYDANGDYTGPMITWDVITSQKEAARREQENQERERAAQEDLRNKVDQLLAVVNAAAEGDLTQSAEFESEDAVGELASGLRRMMGDLRDIISQVVEGAAQFTEGARVVSESAQTLAQGAQTQSASVEEMSASIEELTRSIEAVKDNAGEANKVARSTSDLAEEGGNAVQKSVEAMERIKTSSSQISEIIQVISEIASQTNLLALNAAIEAARAGEHGLGFAVVADEVRKLAERSSEAAKEISTLIKESTQRVEEGAVLSGQTGAALTKIIQGVDETAKKISEIADATVEQAQNANEVSNAIQQVSQVTEQSAAGSEEMASSSEELGAQAASLRDLVARFKIEN